MEWIKVKTDITNIEKVVKHGISLGFIDKYKIMTIEEFNLFFNPCSKGILWGEDDVFDRDDCYLTMSVEEFIEYKGEDL